MKYALLTAFLIVLGLTVGYSNILYKKAQMIGCTKGLFDIANYDYGPDEVEANLEKLTSVIHKKCTVLIY